MPLLGSRGAASAKGFGLTAGSIKTYTTPFHEGTLKLEMSKSASARVDARAPTPVCQLCAINSWLSTPGYQLLAVCGCQFRAINSWLSTLGRQLCDISSWLATLGCQLCAINSWLSTLWYQLLAINSLLSALGERLQYSRFVIAFTNYDTEANGSERYI